MRITIFDKYKRKPWFNILAHSLFWTIFFFFPHIMFKLPYTTEVLLFRLAEVSVLLTIFYVNAYILVPKFLANKKYIAYLLIFFAITISLSRVGYIAKNHMPKLHTEEIHNNYECNDFHSHKEGFNKRYENPKPAFIGFVIFIAFAFSTTYAFIRLNNKREEKLKELEKEQLSSELSFLKSQINPHFLFNVLNSVYALSLKKSDKVPDVVLKLSDLLRYMTYESEDKLVNIEKEITYIENYIDLQKLRLPDNADVKVYIDNRFSQAQISPLILITFIENAFKHGALANGKTNIDIALSINSQNIDLTVVNDYSETSQKDKSSGIGVQNVKRRLEIMYPNKHKLAITKAKNQHIVHLKIQHS